MLDRSTLRLPVGKDVLDTVSRRYWILEQVSANQDFGLVAYQAEALVGADLFVCIPRDLIQSDETAKQ